MAEANPPPGSKSKNKSLAINMALVALGMLMLAYASVPLYRLFCQVTGFGGTTVQATALPDTVLNREMTIRFNADTDPKLPWKFETGQVSFEVKVGEEILSFYTAENMSDKPTTGHATYNVVPHKAGPYFAKVECFCFENQTLQPGQKVNMPISFYVDPLIAEDPELDDIDTITLSYTFFAQESE